MIQQSLGISVLLPALLMLLSAPGHFSVLPICLQKYYLCSWGEGERFYLPSLSVWGIRVSPNNKLCFQTFLRAWPYTVSSLQKPLLQHYGSSFQPQSARGKAG